MSKYKTVAQAEARILKLEEKQRNLQQNFDAQAAGNRQRVRQHEAEIDRLKEELGIYRRRLEQGQVTITASELENEWGLHGNSFLVGFRRAGGRVIPDQEPTNADKLKDNLAVFVNMPGWERRLIADELDKAGVKAGDS